MYIHNLVKDEVIDAMKNGATVFVAEAEEFGSYSFFELNCYSFNQILEFLSSNDYGFFTISE